MVSYFYFDVLDGSLPEGCSYSDVDPRNSLTVHIESSRHNLSTAHDSPSIDVECLVVVDSLRSGGLDERWRLARRRSSLANE